MKREKKEKKKKLNKKQKFLLEQYEQGNILEIVEDKNGK